ncbi:carbamate kinase [Streptomyces sp. NPDC059524]|uniref:carbamate kinase n=1 Tax=Streptomyces sp. NPDC059524 TaxID=3346856 RepID=UPI003678EE53
MPDSLPLGAVPAAVTVVAIGGNALLRGGPGATMAEQFDAARTLAAPLAELAAGGRRLLVTHGNGPQVGFIQRRSELAAALAPELPRLDLDMCVADSQGSLGHILATALGARLRARGLGDRVAALLTHTVVDPADPAFAHPTKPIGSFHTEQEARELAARHGWSVAEDAGRGWRRVVPSPAPRRVVEEAALTALLDRDQIVVAGGGGGIPVVEEPGGGYRGIEAVIDKDATSALLAARLGAELLVITTGVDRVALDHGLPTERPVGLLTAAEARLHLDQGQFPPGSMGPKIEAALAFLRTSGPRARVLITSPVALPEALAGAGGTWIHPGPAAPATGAPAPPPPLDIPAPERVTGPVPTAAQGDPR